MAERPHAIVHIAPKGERDRWHCRCGWRGHDNAAHKAHQKEQEDQ